MIEFNTQEKPKIASLLDGAYEITFKVQNLNIEQFNEFQEGNNYKVSIKKVNNKRSITQNSYAWVLINLIAEKLKLPRTEVYKRLIVEYGNCEVVAVTKKAYDKLKHTWEKMGEGYQVKVYKENENLYTLLLYYGSHVYDSAEMCKFIDGVIAEAQELGIPTMTKEEILRLTNENERSN